MSATTVIDHLAVWWRPLAAGLSDPGRFERLSRALARGPLDAAMDVEAGDGEVVCVRAVEVPPVCVAADVPDDELLETLAAAIAASVKTAVSDARGQEAAVVRYRSRAHAALDVAVSLSRGDHSREWAWCQLGLWPATGEPPAAGGHLATALAEAAGTLPGLLSAAAEAGALGSLAGLVGPAGLDGLVRAAWSAMGRPLPDWADVLGRGVSAPGDADFAQAMALLARGALGRMLLAGAELPPQSIAAASAAALLDGEPSLALGPAARVMRLVTAAALVSLGRSRRVPTARERRALSGLLAGNDAAAAQRAPGGNDAAPLSASGGHGPDPAAGRAGSAGRGRDAELRGRRRCFGRWRLGLRGRRRRFRCGRLRSRRRAPGLRRAVRRGDRVRRPALPAAPRRALRPARARRERRAGRRRARPGPLRGRHAHPRTAARPWQRRPTPRMRRWRACAGGLRSPAGVPALTAASFRPRPAGWPTERPSG